MRMLRLIVVLGAWCLFAGEAAAQYVGEVHTPPRDGGSVGVGTGASIDVEIVTPKQIRATSVFSVKFLCGEILPGGASLEQGSSENASLAQGSPLAPGSYRTAINIHNPNPQAVKFEKKAVIALSQRSLERGRISDPVPEFLLPDEAMEVDCLDINELLFPGGGPPPNPQGSDLLDRNFLPQFIKGFVVIHVPRQGQGLGTLDVVGVYTLKNVDVLFSQPPTPNECIPRDQPCDSIRTINSLDLECCLGLTCVQDSVLGEQFYCQPDPGCF